MVNWEKGQTEKHTRESWLQGKLLTWFTCKDCLAQIPDYPAPCRCQSIQAEKDAQAKQKQIDFYKSKAKEKEETKALTQEALDGKIVKRKLGRPKGSKNKPKR